MPLVQREEGSRGAVRQLSCEHSGEGKSFPWDLLRAWDVPNLIALFQVPHPGLFVPVCWGTQSLAAWHRARAVVALMSSNTRSYPVIYRYLAACCEICKPVSSTLQEVGLNRWGGMLCVNTAAEAFHHLLQLCYSALLKRELRKKHAENSRMAS